VVAKLSKFFIKHLHCQHPDCSLGVSKVLIASGVLVIV
jgi:hypothetical protein